MKDAMPDPTAQPASNGRDVHEEFPRLAKDPIVEAMIVFAARVEGHWSVESTKPLFEAIGKNYPKAQQLNAARLTFTFAPPAIAAAPEPEQGVKQEDLGWAGSRLISEDEKQVVTFGRDGVTFSRLAPYPGWTAISTEATRLWSLFAAHTKVSSIERMHVRYINRLEVPSGHFDPGMYFTGFGAPPAGMERGAFLHQDSLHLKQSPLYMVNVVRTFDAGGIRPDAVPLIIDLEGVRAEPFPAEPDIISQRLAEMHALKNKAFFASVTDAFRDRCR